VVFRVSGRYYSELLLPRNVVVMYRVAGSQISFRPVELSLKK